MCLKKKIDNTTVIFSNADKIAGIPIRAVGITAIYVVCLAEENKMKKNNNNNETMDGRRRRRREKPFRRSR